MKDDDDDDDDGGGDGFILLYGRSQQPTDSEVKLVECRTEVGAQAQSVNLQQHLQCKQTVEHELFVICEQHCVSTVSAKAAFQLKLNLLKILPKRHQA